MPVGLEPLVYPSWIEDWWIRFAKRTMKEDDEMLLFERLAYEVQQLSDRFIADERRDKLRGYGQERDTLLAYGLFFFPQTFTRAQFPIAEAWLRGWRPKNHAIRILDIGAGLGSASLGLVCWLKQQDPTLSITIDALEQSQQSLDWCKRWTEELGEHLPDCRWSFHRGDLRNIENCGSLAAKEQEWDLIIASFSLNEAYEARPFSELELWVQKVLEAIASNGFLLLLEPASKVACERLEVLRDRFVAEKKHSCWSPCLHAKSCPLLAEGRVWCHEVRSWDVPDSLRWLNRRMFRAIESLKFGVLALGKEEASFLEPSFLEPSFLEPSFLEPSGDVLSLRMISPMIAKKGRWLGTGCASDGRRLPLEIQTRQLSREDKVFFKKIERGDLLAIKTEQTLEAHPKTGLVRLPKEAVLAPFAAIEKP